MFFNHFFSSSDDQLEDSDSDEHSRSESVTGMNLHCLSFLRAGDGLFFFVFLKFSVIGQEKPQTSFLSFCFQASSPSGRAWM